MNEFEVFISAVVKYREDLINMANENWAPEQVKMLTRLCGAVVAQKAYEEYEGEADEELDKIYEHCWAEVDNDKSNDDN